RPTCLRKSRRLSSSATRSLAISRALLFSSIFFIWFCKSEIAKFPKSAMLLSSQRTANASGLRRLPWQAGQGWSTSSHSIQESSTWSSVPVRERSASQPTSFSSSPVPTQAGHQPWRELYENRRGSSSAKPRPQDGQERLVENDWIF